MLTWISEFSVFNLRNKCEFLSNCNYRNGNQLWIYDAKSHSISECKMIFSPLLCGINKFWVTVFFLLNTTKEKWWFIIGITLLKHIVRSHSVYRRRTFVYTAHTQTVSHFFKHSACCWVSECECIFFSLRPQYRCQWLCSVSQPLIRCFSFFRLFKCLIRLFTLCLL